MNNDFRAAYIPVGVPTFHLESAQAEFERSAELLRSFCPAIAVPEELLLSIDKLDAFLDSICPDLIVFQNATFANAAYMTEVLECFNDVPIVLWTLREPVIDGGRLRLNSLTGAYSAANMIRKYREAPFEYVFGSPSEESVQRKLKAAFQAARLRLSLRSLRLAAVGEPPQGFDFGRAGDDELLSTFGVRQEYIDAHSLMDRARSCSDDECREYLEDAARRMAGLDAVPEKNKLDFARLYKAYSDYVKENGIGALASRCWPDFFTDYGTPVCAVLAILNDLGIASSCEADAFGALSMYMGQQLTGTPAFFGDPVSLDEKENTISFWHCGTAACSLARPDTGALVGEHCNRHIGPTLEFGCKAAPSVTIFRVGKAPSGEFRFFIASGEALDREKQFLGTSLVVRTNASAADIVHKTVEGGWEPHYAVIYGDCADSLEVFAHMLNIEVLKC